jgi:DNA polymerase-3 subunit delta
MPIYFFWGDDDFALKQAIGEIKDKVVDSDWLSFNYDKISGEQPGAIITGLNQGMSPVFGSGERLIWIEDTTIGQQCPQELLSKLEIIIPQILPQSHLLFSSSKKPDGRLKSTKLLQKYATIREFSLIPPWKTDEILQRVKQRVKQKGVKLTPQAEELLAVAVGNQTRELDNELDKLALYQHTQTRPLDQEAIALLVNTSSQNSLQLAEASRTGAQSQALKLVTDLINRNEAPLKIVATLVGQFRTWTIVKVMLEKGETNQQLIANLAGIANPKRIYFLRQEINNCSSSQLLAALPILLQLEFNLKQGYEPLATLKSKIIQLCTIFSKLSS